MKYPLEQYLTNEEKIEYKRLTVSGKRILHSIILSIIVRFRNLENANRRLKSENAELRRIINTQDLVSTLEESLKK